MRAAFVVISLILAAACGARPPEPLEPPGNIGPPRAPARPRWLPVYRVTTPRPAIDVNRLLPDPTEALRWPRSAMSHPVLEPMYPIADALAQHGVTWLDLCQLGAQNRHASGSRDLTVYLRAWCRLTRRDLDGALDDLEPLLHSVVPQLAPAIPTDIANILVDAGDANHAEKLLTTHRMFRPDILDLVSASYAEIGRNDDAFAINERAINSDAKASKRTRCRRLTRRIVLSPDATSVRELDALAKATQDPICMVLAHEIDCWFEPATSCASYFVDQGVPAQAVGVLLAYHTWPPGPTTLEQWWIVATAAVNSLPTQGGHELAVTALESALRATPCDDPMPLLDIRLAAMKVNHDVSHPPVLEARLAVLMDQPRELCGTGRASVH